MSHEFSFDQTVYLDQAATSRPKAAGVGEAMCDFINEVCANVNRSTYAPAMDAALRVLETREKLCSLFGSSDPTHVILTPGQTVSLNLVIKGLLRSGDHVLSARLSTTVSCARSRRCSIVASPSTVSR